MKPEGKTLDHDFSYFILLLSSLPTKEGREKENEVAKIVIKSHTFLFHHLVGFPNNFQGENSKFYSIRSLAHFPNNFSTDDSRFLSEAIF
jgi:hypothetical protein